jgi:hypothetical protein
MSDKDEGFRLPSEDELGKMLHDAIQGVDMEALQKQAVRAQEMHRLFPEHAQLAMFSQEALMIHTFLEHYLPTQGMAVVKVEPDGTMTPYSEEHDESPVLIPKFFGVDPVKLAEEEPGVNAKAHEYESEDGLETPDPVLAAQMEEFESALASVNTEEAQG